MTLHHFFVQSAVLSLAVALVGGFNQEALAAPGDVVPSRLYARKALQGTGAGRVTVSNPVSPRQPLMAPLTPEVRRSKSTLLHVAPRSAAVQVELPIDAPEDAWVMILPKGGDAKGVEEALRDVALFDPRGLRADPRAAREADARLSGDPARLKAEGINRPLSMLRLDRQMGRGRYVLRVGPKAAAMGLTIDVRVPSSTIELALTASAIQLFPDDEGYVTVGLQSEAPLDHVRFEASLYDPRFERDREVPVVKVGKEYRALVSRVLNERDEPGAWVLEVRAVGSAGGQAFDRLAQTAFGFGVPTARIASAGRPRLVRDAGGKVAALEVEVVLTSQALDRYELSGTLVATDAEGVERPVAEAQVVDQLGAGSHTLTLRFEAGHTGLSGLGGSYALRGLQLYSLGTNTLYHRLTGGLDIRFPEVGLPELVAPRMTPAIRSMVQAGEFDIRP